MTSVTLDKKKLRASFAKVLALKERMPGMVILASHDIHAAELLSEATPRTKAEGE